ncbi:MAG: hypothetical protein MR308_07330 [Lachnospiraceae bacterium]|nr:hypothetical protein [Lachnospiraceae bacterium]
MAAVAGSSAGILYGYDSIPEKWIMIIARLDWIEDLCDKFTISIEKGKWNVCGNADKDENKD